MRSTFRICLFTAVVMAISLTTIASAAKFKQTSTPALGSHAKVIDPATGLPLWVEGPNGQPMECSADQVPYGADVWVYWLTNANGRHTVKLTAREKDGQAEPDIVGAPYVVVYATSKSDIGPHLVTASIWTDEERWDPHAEEYTVIQVPLELARFKPRQIATKTPATTPVATSFENVLLALKYRGRTIEMQVSVDTMQLKHNGIVWFKRNGRGVAKAVITNVVYHRAVEATVTEGNLANGDEIRF